MKKYVKASHGAWHVGRHLHQTTQARICSKSGSPGDIPGVHHMTSVRPPSSSCVTAAEARDRVHQHTALQDTAYTAHRELEGTLEHFRAC